MAKEQKSPYIIIKNRYTQTLKGSMRIVRYWKHKETGNIVEIRKVQNVVDQDYLRVVFFDPLIGQERSAPLKSDRPDPFNPSKIERAFERDYEPYGNFTDRA